MSDFRLDVDGSSVVEAVNSLNKFEDSFAKMVSAVVRESNRMDKVVQQNSKTLLSAQKREAQAVEKDTLAAWTRSTAKKIQLMNRSNALEQKQAKEAERNAAVVAKAKQQEARELERLKIKYKEGYASAALYRKMQDEITTAHKMGAISTRQYEAELESLSQEYTAFQNNAITGANRFQQAQVAGTKSMSNMGVVTQQVGYQVGDFAVQLQSGQSAFVAFSQQATQLVGVLPLMSQQLGMSTMALTGISAALGIGIPVATALAGVLWTVGTATKEAEEKATRFEDALESARSTVQGMEDDLRLLASGFENAFELTLNDAVENARKELEDARENLSNLELGGGTTGYTAFLRVREANRRDEAEERVRLAELELTYAEELVRQTEQRARDESVVNQLHQVRQDLQRQEREEAEAAAKAREEGNLQAQELLETLQSELAIQQAINEYGENSIQVAAARAQEEERVFREMLNSLDASDELKESLYVAFLTAQDLASVDVGNQIRAATADTAAFVAQLSRAVNVAITLDAVRSSGQVYGGRGQAAGVGSTESERFLMNQGGINVSEDARNEELIRSRLNPRSGRSGGSGRAERDDFIESLRKEMEQREELLKLSGGYREVQEEIFRIEKGLGDARSKYSDAQIRQVAQANLLLQEQEELYQQSLDNMQSISDTIEGSMGDAFTSILDGTASVEDAFKNMAKVVIDQLLQIIVQQRIVGSFDMSTGRGTGIMGLLGPSLGLLSFDGGGYTGDGPRSGGVDGKGGFMAVVHPNETVIDHTKGQRNTPTSSGPQQIELILHAPEGISIETVRSEVSMQITNAGPRIVQQSVRASQNNMRHGSKSKWGI